MPGDITKKAIISSFLTLINDRPLDKITIKDISDDCGISRNTFYYHYKDIYDLVEDIFSREAKKALSRTDSNFTWQETFIHAGRFALDNRRGIYHIYLSVNRDQLIRYLFKVTDNTLDRFLRSQLGELDVPESAIHYITVFYRHAIVGMILDWLQDGMKDDPEKTIRELGIIFEGIIRHLLENAAAGNIEN